MAAYGGIMGMDGRKQYGIGSWFQKAKDKVVDDLIPNEIKENPLLTAAAIAGGYDLTRGEDSILKDMFGKIKIPESVKNAGTTAKDFIFDKGPTKTVTRPDGSTYEVEGTSIAGNIGRSLAKNIVPIARGITAGLFTKNTESDTPGLPSDNTGIQLADLKKSANLLDQKQGMAAGLNFLPTVASRKYSPAEMAITYAQAAANGGRIGFSEGTNLRNRMSALMNKMASGTITPKEMIELRNMESASMFSTAKGMAEGGIMDLGGMEKDYRAEGGFVPIGKQEKADDVPARLSVNEFVFTADAVRNAGGGDIDQGAKVMENMMKHLEQGGQVSEESQGMAGARDMFATSQRLGDVI